ncbi:porin [Gilvimarinus polysaccharolyticus]|uniref:porin n=1 Tax=Gilvimarinus polysaccharolyticus TaxID=863921 RepID=UPI000673A519|nr:porin [Gilvimarinus polysaccharolyticus]
MRVKFCLAAAAATLVSAHAAADVTLYGKANVSLQYTDKAGDNETELKSNASRIGVMGSEAIGSGLTAIYRFEYETSIDDGDKDGQTLTQRNIYLGVQSKAGTLMAGKFDTPTKTAQGKIDLFDNLVGDIKNVFAGENRVNNIVQYVTPESVGPFTAKLAYVLDEGGSNGDEDGVSASLAYNADALYVAVAVDQEVDEADVYRLVGAYQLGSVQLGGAYQQATYDNGDDADGFFGSVKWRLDDHWVLKTQYGESSSDFNDQKTLSVGADYVFTKKVKAFTYYTQNDDSINNDGDYLGVGLELKF